MRLEIVWPRLCSAVCSNQSSRAQHAELCAEATPHIVPNNALLFEGLKALVRPILLLSGRAVLLSTET